MNNSSALTINGLAPRGNPILGLSRFKENSTQIPYTTLIYGNGPGNQRPRLDPTIGPNSTDSPYYVQYAAIHQEEAFHDGSDVAVFASGPYAHLFQGVQEQSYIAHVFAYAMCIGDYTNQPHCRQQPAADTPNDLYANSIGRADQNADASTRTTVLNNPSLGRGPPPPYHHSYEGPAPSGFGGSMNPFRSGSAPPVRPTIVLITVSFILLALIGFSSLSPPPQPPSTSSAATTTPVVLACHHHQNCIVGVASGIDRFDSINESRRAYS